jgi:hypothetical protein
MKRLKYISAFFLLLAFNYDYAQEINQDTPQITEAINTLIRWYVSTYNLPSNGMLHFVNK